jgi:prepilin-type N-terminal cleavage/methylation domain-containing protein
MKSESGFSLIEVLVASLITGIMAAGLYAMFDSAQVFHESYADSSSLRQQARVGLDMLSTELRAAGYDMGDLTEAISSATDTSVQFVGDIDDGDAAEPCGTAFEDATNGGAERVSYSLSTDTGDLTRTIDCYNGSAWTTDVQTTTIAEDLDVTAVLFRFFDADGDQLPSSSGGTLSASDRAKVVMVEITFDLVDMDETQLVGEAHSNLNLSTRVRLHNVAE